MREYLEDAKSEVRYTWLNIEVIKIEEILSLASRIIACFEKGGSLVFAGNGGSAAEANHLAAEFVGKCIQEHNPWNAVSLSSNNSILTAIANDFGNEFVFSRQIEANINQESIFIGMSTSGRSPNIIKACETARNKGIYTILWTGLGEMSYRYSDEIWQAPFIVTPRIQEIHLLWGHLLAEAVEIGYGR